MKTAIDTSALLAIFNAEAAGESWLEVLIEARREGRLVICDVVYAELAPAFSDEDDLLRALGKLGVRFEAIQPAAAFEAGRCFGAYRNAGGPRDRPVPDFLVAAHARVQADRLAATDRGYLRRYFSKLVLLRP